MTRYILDVGQAVELVTGGVTLREVLTEDNQIPEGGIVTTEVRLRDLLQEHMCWSDIEVVIQQLKGDVTK